MNNAPGGCLLKDNERSRAVVRLTRAIGFPNVSKAVSRGGDVTGQIDGRLPMRGLDDRSFGPVLTAEPLLAEFRRA